MRKTMCQTMFYNTLFVSLIVCFSLDYSHGQSEGELYWNDYTYIDAVEGFYKIHTTPQTWFDAKRECTQENATLFYPENDEEARAVMSFRNGTQPDIEWMFVGMSDLVSEGVFETIDGKSVSEMYNSWMPDEPNDDLGMQNCVLQNRKGELNDHKCSEKFSYICKKTILAVKQNYSIDMEGEKSDGELLQNNYTYIEAVNSYYKIYPQLQDWFDANSTCAEEGATLFYPENEEEQNAVLSLQNKTFPEIKWMFLGITDLNSEGVFETVDGKLISEVYSNWKSGEPNNKHDNEDCVEQDYKGRMNDCYCRKTFAFICKKKPIMPLKRNVYSCNIDYSLNKDIGKCYKMHTTPLKWTGAYALCRAEQSHLAVINNRLEADYLVNLTESASKHRFGGYQQLSRGVYHLGFHYRFKEGWRTVRGTPLKVDDDAWWDNQQPIVDEREQCGSMFYTGRLNSINCDTKSFFICEHEAKKSTVFG